MFINKKKTQTLDVIVSAYEGKGKYLSLGLNTSNQAPRYEDSCGSGGIDPPSLTSTRDRGELSLSSIFQFTVRGSIPGHIE
jgi:hypothetical protein